MDTGKSFPPSNGAYPAMPSFDITDHDLVPPHEKVPEDDVEAVLEEHNVSKDELPQIQSDDVIVEEHDWEKGDVIKITRESPTAGQTTYYRLVV
jgi:DNA-directed RNA polymerase subunit H